MKQTENLIALQEALSDAHDYVTAHLATGGKLGDASVPFNPRAEVMNQLRDALRFVTFQHDGAPAASAYQTPTVVALSTSGLATIDVPQVTA